MIKLNLKKHELKFPYFKELGLYMFYDMHVLILLIVISKLTKLLLTQCARILSSCCFSKDSLSLNFIVICFKRGRRYNFSTRYD